MSELKKAKNKKTNIKNEQSGLTKITNLTALRKKRKIKLKMQKASRRKNRRK